MNGTLRLRLVLAASNLVLLGVAPARAQFFREVRSLTVPGGAPRTAAAAGDFNGDGIVDLAVDYYDSQAGGGLRVFLGLGGGSFGPPIPQPGAPGWRQVATGDLNEDGKLDLFVANGSHAVLFGDGAGHFATVPIGGGTTRVGVGIADADRDGHQDLLGYDRTLGGQTTLLVYRGNGAGGFAPPSVYLIAFDDGGMAAGDLNGDGAVDVAATDPTLGRVSLLLNNGTGGFTSAGFYPIGVGADSVALGDLNGDGRLDLMVANPDARTLAVLLGNGPGTFAPPVLYAGPGPGIGQSSVGTADLDLDGRLDVVVSDGGVWVYRGNGAGGLAAPARYVASGLTAIADLDGDGKRDLATGNAILINRGGLDFDAPRQYGVGRSPRAVAAADLNHDGRADLVTANRDTDDVSVLLGNGDGTFTSPVSVAAGDAPQRLAMADLNADGHTDIAVANHDSGDVSILLGNGAGSFAPRSPVAAGSQPEGISAGDLDGNGRTDLAVATSAGIALLLGAGNGTFTAGNIQPLPGPGRAVAIASLNPDVRLDLVAGADAGASSLGTMLGIGGAQFLAPEYPLDSSSGPVVTAFPLDFDVDSATDLAVAFGVPGGLPKVLRGDGVGGLTAVPILSIDRLTPFNERGLAAADFTRDGKLDIVSGGISLLIGDGGSFAVFERPVGAAGGVSDLATADFNGDGQPDLAAVLRDGDVVEVLLNQAASPGADLSVAVTHSPDPAVYQGVLTYTVTASNQGPLPAQGVLVGFYLSTGVSLLPAPPNCSTSISGPPALFCTLGDLAVSASAAVSVSVLVGQSNGVLTSRADVQAVEPRDLDPFDNDVTHVTPIGYPPDLSVSIEDSVDPVASGAPFTYSVLVSNAGPGEATLPSLVDTLPNQVAFVSASNPNCSFVAPNIACNLPPIPAGQSVAVLFNVMAGSFTSVTNVVSVTADDDTNLANNQDSEDTRMDLATGRELPHGTQLQERFPAGSSDRIYFIREEPRSSYEVVVDGLAGDVAPAGGSVLLERLGDDLAPVQSATATGTGPSRSLRWENTRATAVIEAVRVRSTGCGTACDAGDVYRIRAYETTGRIARFRNMATQVSVVLLQNPTSTDVHGTVWIWSNQGAMIGNRPFTLGPRQQSRIDLAAIVPGREGGLTVTHDAPYGSLVAKAVGLEPAFAFTFDTPMVPRLR